MIGTSRDSHMTHLRKARAITSLVVETQPCAALQTPPWYTIFHSKNYRKVSASTVKEYAVGMFDFMRGPSMDEGVREYRNTEGAVLLDVRTPQEFNEGHVPGSMNIPLQELDRIATVVPGPTTPLFVYCQSGGRSRRAVAALQRAGYLTVKNIGGMNAYRGEVERS